jgi:hypothetical protein
MASKSRPQPFHPHTNTQTRTPSPSHIYIHIHTHRPTTPIETKCKYGGGHIHKRKKQTNKVDLISNMSPTPERKKKASTTPIIQSPWNMGEYPTGFWPHTGFPNHHYKVGVLVVVVDEHQRKKVSVCANNKCRTAPHHMAPKSLIIMQSWMHGVSPKCPKE